MGCCFGKKLDKYENEHQCDGSEKKGQNVAKALVDPEPIIDITPEERARRILELDRMCDQYIHEKNMKPIQKMDSEFLRQDPSSATNLVNLRMWTRQGEIPGEWDQTKRLTFDFKSVKTDKIEFSPRGTRAALRSIESVPLYCWPKLGISRFDGMMYRAFEVTILETNDDWDDQIAVGMCTIEEDPPPNFYGTSQIKESWLFGWNGKFITPEGDTDLFASNLIDWNPLQVGDVLRIMVRTSYAPQQFIITRNGITIVSIDCNIPKYKNVHACITLNGRVTMASVKKCEELDIYP